VKMNTRQFAAIRRQKQLRALESEANDLVTNTPTISLSTLAKAMGPLSPAALVRLLSGHKHGFSGPRRSYQRAREQAISLLTDGTPLDVEAPLRGYERDAVKAIARAGLRLPEHTRALRMRRKLPYWEIGGVRISMDPDVELDGQKDDQKDGHKATGAAKVILTKEPLARGVGSAMAALMWHYRKNVLNVPKTDREHCIVFEPRLPWLHLPAKRPDNQVRNAELACQVVAALWPSA
jgi:hypothetical protein